jgi:RNA polymerase sigma factor (sigma-70 family)
MADKALRTVLHHLRRVADLTGPNRPTDSELLERFAIARDQAAFEVLVWRHGPMVLNVCRRMLHHEQDAEDAFQATFLTLVRKAGSISKGEALGSWLYKVAYRVALEANARTVKRTQHETTGVETLAAKAEEDPNGRELHLAVGEEVSRLPDKYRVPLVLHCFEGKTSQEVAQQLGCAEATVRTRLARARARLRTRLARRGLVLTAGLLEAGLAPRALPAALVDSTVKAAALFAAGKASAAGVVSGHAVALTQRVLKYMLLSKLKHMAAMVMLVGVCAAGTGLSIRQALAQKPAVQQEEHAQNPSTTDASQPKDDRTEIRGTWESWTTVTRSTGRETFPPEKEKDTYVITDDKIMWVGKDGFLDREETFKLNPTQRPKAIDFMDRVTGTTFFGIYELEGDTLRTYSSRDKRPTEFPSKTELLKGREFKRVSRVFAPVAQRFDNAPGCYWVVEPNGTAAGFALGGVGINYMYDKEPDGAAVITMAYLSPEPYARQYRPVLVDAAHKRYLPKFVRGVSSGGRRGERMVVLHRWRIDPNVLPAANVAGLGVEAITPESLVFTAREAQERAKSLHIEVLPWPEAGKPYSFTLTTIDGQKIRSEDWKGKVVLVHCWSTNSAPDRWLMPELKAVYQKWHPRGLETIGVSRNGDAEIVRRVCKEEGVNWPQVLVPEEEGMRQLWQEASGIETVPGVLIIDQKGILQVDSTDKLEARIAKLLRNSSQKTPMELRP